MAEAHDLLTPPFPAKHITAALSHFSKAVVDFGQSDWEGSISKAGKFVEAVLKGVATLCNVPFDSGRKFNAGKVMDALGQLGHGTFDDSLRLLIPRACRVVYDIASNRGARHDSDEIDANPMDANLVNSVCGWILADLIRYAQKGAVDPSDARNLVETLVEKKYPIVEEIDGRIYLHAKKKSAVDVALVVLARQHPKRMDKAVLAELVRRNGFSANNANLAVTRIGKYVDNDSGRLHLLAPGLKRADEIISSALDN